MKTFDILWGLLTQKPEALEYILKKKPVLMSMSLVFVSAFFASILILLTERSTFFILLSLIIFMKVILMYWIAFSIAINFGFNAIYKTKISSSQILSFMGVLSPLFSILLTLWELIIRVTTPNIIYFLILSIPTIYFVILLSNGLATIYQQQRKYVLFIVITAMIVWLPIVGILDM